MYVSRFMKTNVTTISSDMLVNDAQHLMIQNSIRHLPVVDNGQLVGIVTRATLRDVAPSSASTLSVWEYNFLLSKVRVKDIMTTNVITTTSDSTMEDAAVRMQQQDVSCLPVVDKDNRVIGLVTRTDMFKLLTNVLGICLPGARIQITQPYQDKPGGKLAEIVSRHGAKILSVFTYNDPQNNLQEMVLRLSVDDPTEIIKDFNSNGYEVVAS